MFLIFFGIRYIPTPQNTALMSPFRPYSNRRHRTSIGVPQKKLEYCRKKKDERIARLHYYSLFLKLLRYTI